MKVTRDGTIWLVLFIGGLAGFLFSHFELVSKAFPGISVVWQARLELAFVLTGYIGAYLRMSPARLSQNNPMATTESSQTLTITGQIPKGQPVIRW